MVWGVEELRREALWRGSPWATPPHLALCRVLRRIRVGFLVGGEGLDLGFGFSESLEPFLLVDGDVNRSLGTAAPDARHRAQLP